MKNRGAFMRLVRRRMKLPGNYIICFPSNLHLAKCHASPGDTISLHDHDGVPTLFEVLPDGELCELAVTEEH